MSVLALPLTLVRSGCDVSGVLSLVSEGLWHQVTLGRAGLFSFVVDPPGFDAVAKRRAATGTNCR